MTLSDLFIVSKKIIVTRLICFFWLIAKAISYKVWLANRLFPVVPPFNFLFVPSFIHLVLFIFSLLALMALFIFPSKRILQVSVIIIEVLACLLDQNRWQPWEYQYIFIIITLVINYKNDNTANSVIAFISAAIYFYSGLGKMNDIFSITTYNAFRTSGILHSDTSYFYNLLVYHIGYALGIIELLLSIGLLFQRTKKTAAIFLILMHVLILIVIGPFGTNYDIIVWPWNVVMILLLYTLFISKPRVSIPFKSITKGWNKLIFILFAIMPAFNFFGYWDYFLSESLFSCKPPDMYICVANRDRKKEMQTFFINKNKFLCGDSSFMINVRTWSFQEIMVPAYPELRVYKNIKSQLLKRYPDMEATFFVSIYINGQKKTVELK